MWTAIKDSFITCVPVLKKLLMMVMERLEMEKLVMKRSKMAASEIEKAEVVLKVLQCFRMKPGSKGRAQPQ